MRNRHIVFAACFSFAYRASGHGWQFCRIRNLLARPTPQEGQDQ